MSHLTMLSAVGARVAILLRPADLLRTAATVVARAAVLVAATLAGAAALAACAGPRPAPDGEATRGGPATSHVHFLIPGAPGGGWDGTARGVGDALVRSGLAPSVSYENLSGGGGGRALAHFVATAERHEDTLLVSSTPIVIAAIRGKDLPRTWRDTTPVASLIGDYIAFAARADAPLASWRAAVAALERDPSAIKIAGGSVLGGMDHLVSSLAFAAAGLDPAALRYVPYDTGGKARAALFAGETALLATGLGEVLDARRSGLVRLLAVTAPQRVPEAGDVPTLGELGAAVEFVNWRGFFAPPGIAPERVERWIALFRALLATPEWEEVRRRNGWVEIFRAGTEFERFLDAQEAELAELLEGLG